MIALGAGALAAFGGFLSFNAYAFHEVFRSDASATKKIREKAKAKAPAKKSVDPRVEWIKNKEAEILEVKDENGKTLRAKFIAAESESRVFVIGAHGYRTNGSVEFRYIAKFYHDQNINLLLIDHPGSGESEGDYVGFGFNESKAILLWIDLLREKFGDDISIILHGISMGCSAIFLNADNEAILPNVKFIVSDCAFTSMRDQFEYYLKTNRFIPLPLLISLSATCRLILGYDFRDVVPIEHVRRSLVPILFFHSGNDSSTPVEMAKRLFDACGAEKELFIAEGAPHVMGYKYASEEYEKRILDFVGKYIPS